VAALGDLLALTGNAEEAERQYTLVEYIEHVNELNQTTYTRQLALFYADHDRQLEDARRLAEAEGARRHDIYTQDTLAWVYYKSGRMAEAERAMAQALRLGTQDVLLFFHAGMIAQRLGKQQQAREYLRRALTLNPAFHPFQANIAAQVLKELEWQPGAAVAQK
jgi:tetratricopeptide (TPR) repeat protein